LHPHADCDQPFPADAIRERAGEQLSDAPDGGIDRGEVSDLRERHVCDNFVGLSDGPGAKADLLHWLATSTNVVPLRGTTRHVKVTARDGPNSLTGQGQALHVLLHRTHIPVRIEACACRWCCCW